METKNKSLLLSGVVMPLMIGSVEMASSAVLHQEKSELGGGNGFQSLPDFRDNSGFVSDALRIEENSKPGLLQNNKTLKAMTMNEDLDYLSTEGDVTEDDIEEQDGDILDNFVEYSVDNRNETDTNEGIRKHKIMVSVLDDFEDKEPDSMKDEAVNNQTSDEEYDFDVDDAEFNDMRRSEELMKQICEDLNKPDENEKVMEDVVYSQELADPTYNAKKCHNKYSSQILTIERNSSHTLVIYGNKDDDIYRNLYDYAHRVNDEYWRRKQEWMQLSWFGRIIRVVKKAAVSTVNIARSSWTKFTSWF